MGLLLVLLLFTTAGCSAIVSGQTDTIIEAVRFQITATVEGTSETVMLNEDTSYELTVRVGRGISIQKGLETTPVELGT